MALEAWTGQTGGDEIEVIFDGKVYSNAWWVEPQHCPGKWQEDPSQNPWRVKRPATANELAELGNQKLPRVLPSPLPANTAVYSSA
ncbi:hypothetical protein AB0H76_20640 [Nocardia sp. NPDC050712]|uniref:hypothetical protein n=1 Tax=Nocardia sp. NPDC050712 TaxID=3155518 RepID=UPI0033CB5BB1